MSVIDIIKKYEIKYEIDVWYLFQYFNNSWTTTLFFFFLERSTFNTFYIMLQEKTYYLPSFNFMESKL
jgi:hypothetical protein